MCRKQFFRLLGFIASMSSFAVGLAVKLFIQRMQIAWLENVWFVLWQIALLLFVLVVTEFLLSHHIEKGFRYFWQHWKICIELEQQLVDAGFSINRGNCIKIPKYRLSFSKDFSNGTLKIKNTMKHDVKLDNVEMSSALGNYAVERHFQTENKNYHIYELTDAETSYKLEFHSTREFLKHNATVAKYMLFLDKRTQIKIQHTLIVGQTGSGKSYSLYSLILQMLNKEVDIEISFADPKGSSLAVIGEAVAPNRTAIGINEIISLLEAFVEAMQERKAELKEKLKTKIDSDYSTFSLMPYVFICDEYASFVSVLASEDKKIRDKVKSMLYEVILQGRQLGFFVFLVMQKSDATLIDTALRDNIPLKIVMGNSEQQTYVTAFGAGADIPNRNYAVGEGVFTEPTIAPQPRIVQCPYCNFDILEAVALARTPVV